MFFFYPCTVPEINICPVPAIVCSSPHFVSVTHNSCRSQFSMRISIDCYSNIDTSHNCVYNLNDIIAFIHHTRHFLSHTELVCK